MHVLATLSTLLATLTLAQAVPFDRAAIVAANQARQSAYVASSRASVASVASVASAEAAWHSSISSMRNAVVASNQAKQSTYVSSSRAAAAAAAAATASAAPTPSGFVTVPASQRPTATAAPSAPASSSAAPPLDPPPVLSCAPDDTLCLAMIGGANAFVRLKELESQYEATCTGGKADYCTGPHAQPTAASSSRS
ncbi:hypothetical protein JCM3775_002219 [Rhodotorula graminis]